MELQGTSHNKIAKNCLYRQLQCHGVVPLADLLPVGCLSHLALQTLAVGQGFQ